MKSIRNWIASAIVLSSGIIILATVLLAGSDEREGDSETTANSIEISSCERPQHQAALDHENTVIRLELTTGFPNCSSVVRSEGASGNQDSSVELQGIELLFDHERQIAWPSPDGQWLALAAPHQPSLGGNPQSGLVRIINATTLQSLELPAFNVAGSSLAWSRDSQTLYSLNADGELWRLNLESRRFSFAANLGYWGYLVPGPEKTSIYVLGFQILDGEPPERFKIQGNPFLAEINVEVGRELRRADIPGLKAGLDEESEVFNRIGVDVSFDDMRFYIGHADSDAVSVVDLRSMRLIFGPMASREGRHSTNALSSIVDMVSSLLVTPAEAKALNANLRSVQLTPDGRYLLLTGTRSGFDKDSAQWSTLPMGMNIFDTHEMKIIKSIDGVQQFLISRDGSHLYTVGSAPLESTSLAEPGASLQVIDLNEFNVVRQVSTEGAIREMALSTDGRYLHLVIQSKDTGESECSKQPCVRVLNVESMKLISVDTAPRVKWINLIPIPARAM